jgi:hypothetical protein
MVLHSCRLWLARPAPAGKALQTLANHEHFKITDVKSFIALPPVANVIKPFKVVSYERLSLASLSSLVYCLLIILQPSRIKHLLGAPL